MTSPAPRDSGRWRQKGSFGARLGGKDGERRSLEGLLTERVLFVVCAGNPPSFFEQEGKARP